MISPVFKQSLVVNYLATVPASIGTIALSDAPRPRSFVYQEALHQFPPTVDEKSKKLHPSSTGLLFSTWICLLQERLAALPLPQLKPKEFNLWRSESYFKEKNLPASDLATFLDEYVGMFPIKQYPYTVYGIPDGVPQLLTSERSRNHELELAELGLKTQRAQLETWVALSLEAWMADESLPLGSLLVSISPRGSRNEGYPGESKRNYVFVNVYQKVSDCPDAPQHQLTQYLSFDDNNQLQTLLDRLTNELGGRSFSPQALPFQPQQPAHQIIAQLVTLPPTTTQDTLKSLVQAHAKTWPIQLSDLPALPMHDYATHKHMLIAYCQEQFEQMVKEFQLDTQDKNAAANAAADFDLLIKVVRKWFLKWAEVNATNYKAPDENPFTTPETLLANIDESWQLERKQRSDQQLSQAEASRLKQLSSQVKLNPLTPLFRLSSVAHCIVGTPGSLALKSISLNNLASLKAGGTFNADLLSVSQRLELTTFLETLTRIKVLNTETGKFEYYYIQLTDPQYTEDYTSGCYIKTVDGQPVVFGPCDIPLSEDGLVVPGSLMSEGEYKTLRHTLAQQELESAKDSLLENPDLTEEQKELIDKVFTAVSSQLFTTSLTSFISGVTEPDPIELLKLPPDFWATLARTPNPVPLLKHLLSTLDRSELEELEAHTLYPDKFNSPHSISSGGDSIIGHHGRHSGTTSTYDFVGDTYLSAA